MVIRRAAEADLDVIALTDHDTVAGHREAAGALPAGPDAAAGRGAVLPPRRPQRAHAGLPVRPGRTTRWPARWPRSGRAGCTGPAPWSTSWPSWACRSPGSRSARSPAAAWSAGRISPGRWSTAGVVVEHRRGVHAGVDRPWRPRARVQVRPRPGQGHPPGPRARAGSRCSPIPAARRRGWQIPDEVIADLAAAGLTGHRGQPSPAR